MKVAKAGFLTYLFAAELALAGPLPTLIDFNNDVPGLPPATGGTDEPTAILTPPGTSVFVESTANGIVTQPVVLEDSGTGDFVTVEYSFPGTEQVRVDAIVSFDRLFSGIFLQTSESATQTVVTRLLALPSGEIQAEADKLNPRVTVGNYLPNVPFRLRMDIDLEAGTWSLLLNDTLTTDLPFTNDRSRFSVVGAVLASLNVFDSGQPEGPTSVAYDDILIEPLSIQAEPISRQYLYRGNRFNSFQGVPGVFSEFDRVEGAFSINCNIAHSEGDCKNLPFDNYLENDAIDIDSLRFSAGPVDLPTADGQIDIRTFLLSTDENGDVRDWDIDLYLAGAALNIDTDNQGAGTDSAAGMGGFASIVGEPGVWGTEYSRGVGEFDISVAKTVEPSLIRDALQPVEFTVTVENSGPAGVIDVVVIDQLPDEMEIPQGMAAYASTGYYDAESGRWEVGDIDDTLPQYLVIPAVPVVDPLPPCIINSASLDSPGDSNPQNDTSSVSLRRVGVTECTDVGIDNMELIQSTNLCEDDFRVRFQLSVRNSGPEPASKIVLKIEETQFKAPGLEIYNHECQDLRCVWSAMDVGDVRTVSGGSDSFNVSNSKQWELRAQLTPEDLDAGNDIAVNRITIYPHHSSGSCDVEYGKPKLDIGISGGGSGCFIATAVYGSKSHPYVQKLREFRDDVLLESRLGQKLVEIYYRRSPGLACMVEENEVLRSVTWGLITAFVLTISYPWFVAIITALLVLFGVYKLRRASTKDQSYLPKF